MPRPSCPMCEELIADGDRVTGPRDQPVHLECALRASLGSAQHILRESEGSPCDHTCRDPEGMTKREAARAAVDVWRALHGDPPIDWTSDDPWLRGALASRALNFKLTGD